MLILITGAASGGKSRYAEDLALSLPFAHRIYLATMEDKEYNRDRIDRHRSMREGKGFETVECETDILRSSERIGKDTLVLLEDIPNLLANEMFSKKEGKVPGYRMENSMEISERLGREIITLSEKAGTFIAVTGELLSDGNVYDAETEGYLKALSRINRMIAHEADSFFEVAAGIGIQLKGGN
ncbi:MAG: bifunctional adenosylcobinamide kinase/adenosylcobinamide-phosphate guanylyltransferase [Lachnospiraceae bacterium]|nr:bifunctional adenosylcobinamide kinase/adenosylcobinamide-phosphate guanylyltransferase [Lachnospiraceae bacterium]